MTRPRKAVKVRVFNPHYSHGYIDGEVEPFFFMRDNGLMLWPSSERLGPMFFPWHVVRGVEVLTVPDPPDRHPVA